MGNTPNHHNQLSNHDHHFKRQLINPGCIGCFVNTDFKSYETVDNLELQTHNKEQVPKGKISIRSISYLTSDEIGFLKACAGKNISAIRYYLKKSVNVNLLDEDRTSPLHVACRSGSLQVVEELLNQGAMIDIADIAGWTPLHIAAQYQRPYVSHILLKKGAYPYHVSRNGETPWDLVKDKATEEIFFVHFDRVELRKMSKVKTINPPGEIVDENIGITGSMPKENAFRSMIELENKESLLREGHITSSMLNSPQNNIKNIKNKYSKVFSNSTEGQNLFRENDVNASTSALNFKSENIYSQYEEQLSKTNSNKKSKTSVNNGVVLPKKHKYYLYFKNLKLSQFRGDGREQEDFLCTLRSEDESNIERGAVENDQNENSGVYPNVNLGPINQNELSSQQSQTDFNKTQQNNFRILLNRNHDEGDDDNGSENLTPIDMASATKYGSQITNSGGVGGGGAGSINHQQQGYKNNNRNQSFKGGQLMSISRNQSLNNSINAQLNNSKIEKQNTSAKSLILFQPTISLMNLISKGDEQEIGGKNGGGLEPFVDSDIEESSVALSQLYGFEKQSYGLDKKEETVFKVNPNYFDTVYKMGVELFNYEPIKGLAFLVLFKIIRKNLKEIAFFLYKEESLMTFKKSPYQISSILTNFKIKECQELLQNYAQFYHFDGYSFFDGLKNYLIDFKVNGDPEKIDWILRGFAQKFYHKIKKQKELGVQQKGINIEFQSAEAIHMLSFACVMTSIEIHYNINKASTLSQANRDSLSELKTEFESNLLGVNEGENFNKEFINELFNEIHQKELIKIEDTQLIVEKPKKLFFRSSKFVIKGFKQSQRNPQVLKDYLLYFNGPIIFVIRLFEAYSIPRCVLLATDCKFKNYKNSIIQFLPKQNIINSQNAIALKIGIFNHSGITVHKKSEISFTLQNPNDCQKIESHFQSFQ